MDRSSVVASYRSRLENRMKLMEEVERMSAERAELNKTYVTMIEAQQLLAAVSDTNTQKVLDYITGVINKALSEMFPYDERRIFLEKKMYRNTHAHIVVKLVTGKGIVRDLTLQTGTGLRQVISFLFLVSLIEIRGGRRILLMDELFSGLHSDAKAVISDIISIFAEEGFQFVFVEYGLNDLGRIYNVEKLGETAKIYPLDGDYTGEAFIFNRPAEEIDKSIYVDEEAVD